MTMLQGPVIECKLALKRGHHCHKRQSAGPERKQPVSAGRVPRVSRLMALALKLDGQIRRGELRDWADVARLGRVTRARASQLASLTLLAPDIIETLLHLPIVEHGRDSITEHHLRPLAAQPSWRRQRRMWQEIAGDRRSNGDSM